MLGPVQIGALGASGVAAVTCSARPRVAILATGDELRNPGEKLEPGQIYESNRRMVAAALAGSGADVDVLPVAADDADSHRIAMERGLQADVLVTSGGVSMGPHDLVRRVAAELGVEEIFWGVAVKPGKPLDSYYMLRLVAPFAAGQKNSNLAATTTPEPPMPIANFTHWDGRPSIVATWCWIAGLKPDGSNADAPIDYGRCDLNGLPVIKAKGSAAPPGEIPKWVNPGRPKFLTLAKAAPDRTLWATNWPHPTPGLDKPDDAWTLDMLLEWLPDETARNKTLVDNPARLYGF